MYRRCLEGHLGRADLTAFSGRCISAPRQVYAEAAARLGVDLAAAPHAQRHFSLAAAPGGFRRLLHRPAELAFRLLQYGDPDQVLAATDLDKLRGTAPPPLLRAGAGAVCEGC